MKKGWITLGVIAFIIVLFVGSLIGMWNSLNAKYQAVKGGESYYSSALNISPEKIKGVWTMSQQYLDHESKTFQSVAEARSGFLKAKEGFEKLKNSKASSSELIKNAQIATRMFTDFQRAAGLAINVQIERYPQLRGADTTQQAMRTLEEGVNEIKTALDDWIFAIKAYNTYRGRFWPSIWGGVMSKFPSEIEYYVGEVKKLDIQSLNPKTAN